MPRNSQGSYFFNDLQEFLIELESYLQESEKYLIAAHRILGSNNCNFSAMTNCVNSSKQQVSQLRSHISDHVTVEEEKYYAKSLFMLMNQEY